MSTVHAFCPSCGGNVVCTVTVVGNKKRTTCRNCHYLVEERTVAAAPTAAPEPEAAAVPAASAGPRTLGTVLSAEDTPAIRNALQNMLVSKGVAKNVVSAENGFDALVAFHKAMRQKAKIDLLVLDVNMPILDGINLAVCIRAAEKALALPKHPILFFTSNVCDDLFSRALEYLAPARYLNKGAPSSSGEEFGERLVAVIKNLLGTT